MRGGKMAAFGGADALDIYGLGTVGGRLQRRARKRRRRRVVECTATNQAPRSFGTTRHPVAAPQRQRSADTVAKRPSSRVIGGFAQGADAQVETRDLTAYRSVWGGTQRRRRGRHARRRGRGPGRGGRGEGARRRGGTCAGRRHHPPNASAALLHSSPAGQPAPASHCSPAPGSTTPSPQVEWRARKLALILDRGTLTVPLIISQLGSIVAVSFALPWRPVHERDVAFTLVPFAVALSVAFVERQMLPNETCLPVITIASGATSPGSSGEPCTR